MRGLPGTYGTALAAFVVAGSAGICAPARAQTAEETAALLWLAIEDGAELNGDRAKRVSRSPAVFETTNLARKQVSARITVTRRSDCTYHFEMAPAAWVRDSYGDEMGQRSEWQVDFSRVTSVEAYRNEPDTFYFHVDGPPMCTDIGDGRICVSSHPRPLNGPPTARARQVLAQFQKSVCKPSQ